MKTLKNYIKESLSLDMKLNETSLLDIEGTMEVGDEAIKKIIEKWINDNFKVTNLKISDNPNNDGKYEVSAANVNIANRNIISLTNDMFIWKIVESFNCSNCPSLISLEGAPEKVGRNFDCSNCESLKSLEGAPEKVGRNFDCSYCPSLISLEGSPKEVGRDFYCYDCKSLTSLEGSPKEIDGNFLCNNCDSLKALKCSPKKVGGRFDCHRCKSLTSLEGAPKEVKGDFDCSECDSLKSTDLPSTTKIKGKIIDK